MEKYIGTKIIEAEPMCKDGINGYKVIYNNPNNTKYESWSPKDVFEESYIELSQDLKLMREKICDIFSEANSQYGQFMPQQYVTIFLDLCSENGITYIKTKEQK